MYCVCPGSARAGALRRLPRRSPERIPARLGTPPLAPHTPPLPSWDHMFLCNGFCCSPPLSYCFLFKKFTLQLFYFTCFSDIISLVSPRPMKSSPLMYPTEYATLQISIYEILMILKQSYFENIATRGTYPIHVTLK